MKTIKTLALVLLLCPLLASAQTKSGSASSKLSTAYVAENYPLYNDAEAAKLWKMWIKKDQFTQEDYARVIALSDASFNYLTIELQKIIETAETPAQRVEMALELDKGVTSNMANFARTFALRMQNLAVAGELSEENMTTLVDMLAKKQVYREVFQEVYHPKE